MVRITLFFVILLLFSLSNEQLRPAAYEAQDICQVEQGVQKAKYVKKKSLTNRLHGATCDLPYSYHEISEVSSGNKFSQKGHRTNRPNYFIAIQVTDLKVLENAKRIQDSILEESPTDLRHMKVDIRKSHITLMAMHLADSVDINSAKQCLDKCLPIVSPNQSGLITLDFEGLNVFSGGSVLYVTVKKNPALQSLISMSDVITKEMKQHGIVGAGKDFVPHMTLMKYRRKKQTQNYAKKIPKEAYSKFVKEYIGTQTINSIQLCKMEGVREDGYYIVEHEVFFDR